MLDSSADVPVDVEGDGATAGVCVGREAADAFELFNKNAKVFDASLGADGAFVPNVDEEEEVGRAKAF